MTPCFFSLHSSGITLLILNLVMALFLPTWLLLVVVMILVPTSATVSTSPSTLVCLTIHTSLPSAKNFVVTGLMLVNTLVDQ